MFCPKCGGELADGAKFCRHCGAAQETAPAPEVPVSRVQFGNQTPRPEPRTPVTSGAPATPVDTSMEETVAFTPPVFEAPVSETPAASAPVFEAPAPKAPKKKMSKGKKIGIIVGSVVAALVIIVVGLFLFVNGSDAHRSVQLLEEGKYTEFASLYTEKVQGNGIQEFIFDLYFGGSYDSKKSAYESGETSVDDIMTYMSFVLDLELADDAQQKLTDIITARTVQIPEDFSAGTLEYDAAMDELQVLDRYESYYLSSHLAEDAMEMLNGLKNSDQSYTDGAAAQSSKNWRAAIKSYSQVAQFSSHYEDAQTQLTACQDAYREEIISDAKSLMATQDFAGAKAALEDADEYLPGDAAVADQMTALEEACRQYGVENSNQRVEDHDYEGAISVLEYCLEVMPSDKALTDQLRSVEENYRSYAKQTALEVYDASKENGDWLTAIQALTAAKEVVGEDADVNAALTKSMSAYAAAIRTEVDAILDEDWDQAKAIVDAALSAVPDSTELKELQQWVMEMHPVELSALYEFESRFYYIGEYTDTYGKTYSNCIRLSPVYGDDGYVILNANAEYNTLVFDMVVQKDSGDTALVKIYTDDVLLFEKELSKTSEGEHIELNITGCKLLKIVVDHNAGADVLFVDAIVKKAQ